ncbi:UPF0687 protein C20orf27 homolog [Daphnia pulex]|uniref:UPF0687 protein C20orf27 homolog n=1 Tax=Daphnia pulex TaxID=6669 RepID=UPI001EDF0BF3|nr:UPF0687 protein C20orf27 homolog [Daphnia pulex]XP_046653167.1 UPF0687 protein C20orf27 homolog [Daphnia pulicaria]
MAEAGEHHVKFNEEHDNYNKQNSINIQKISQWKFQVHLGFLKLNNTYEIVIDVGPILESPQSPDNTAWISNDCSAGAYTSIKSCENSNNKVNLHLILKAAKPKLMNEAIKLYSSADPTVHIEIVLLARVLGKGQGTPMLKDGIHLVGVELDEESEASDWQGFD